MALRQTEGLIGSILQLLDLDLAVPDHSTLSRRAETLKLPKPRSGLGCGPVHLLVDSTGLRSAARASGSIEKHGTKRRRAWRVLHLATDADTGRIVASVLTDKDADDGSQVGPLLDQVDGPVASVTGDGAYDRDDVYAEVAARHPAAAVVVPPRANAVPSEAAETAPTQRDRHLRCIAERGRMGWQKASGYNWRALVEADISRWKRVIGDGLRFANGRATGDRGGDRRRRAEPNAGAGTPGVRPHRMTRNTGRAQCAHTADPCNKVPRRLCRPCRALLPVARTFAVQAGISKSAAGRDLAELEAEGHLTRTRRPGGVYVCRIARSFLPRWAREQVSQHRDRQREARHARRAEASSGGVPEPGTEEKPDKQNHGDARERAHSLERGVSFGELPDERAKWQARLRSWRQSRFWLPLWGPKPNEPGCFAPVKVLQAVG